MEILKNNQEEILKTNKQNIKTNLQREYLLNTRWFIKVKEEDK